MILRLRRAWAYLVFSHRRHCERSVWQIWQWRTQETIVYLLMLLLFCNMVGFECTWFILKKHTMFGTFTSYMVHSLRPFALFSSIFSISIARINKSLPLQAPDLQAPWFLQWKHMVLNIICCESNKLQESVWKAVVKNGTVAEEKRAQMWNDGETNQPVWV